MSTRPDREPSGNREGATDIPAHSGPCSWSCVQLTLPYRRVIQLGKPVLWDSFLWLLFPNFWIKNPSPFKLNQTPHTVVNKSKGHESSRGSWWVEHQGKASFGGTGVREHTQIPTALYPVGYKWKCYHLLRFDFSKLEACRIKMKWTSFMICRRDWEQILLQETRDNLEIPDSSQAGGTLPRNHKTRVHAGIYFCSQPNEWIRNQTPSWQVLHYFMANFLLMQGK